MQGHKSSVTTLPENLSFDHGSTSSEPGIDSQISWNNMQTSTHNRLPEYRISSNDTNIHYLHPVGHEGLNAEWSLGETSSAASHSQGENNERKRVHSWSIHTRAALTSDEPQYQPSDILSSDNINANANISQTAASMSSLPRVVDRPNTYISIGSPNDHMPSSFGNSSDLPSGSGVYVMDESEHGPGCSLDGRRISCKRKSLEVHAGESSDAERSNISSMSMLMGNGPVINNGPDQANPRLRLGVGGPLSANPFSTTARGAPECTRRNFRLRINGSRQHDHHVPGNPFLPGLDPVNADIPSSQNSPSLVLRNHLFDLNPTPAVENGSLYGQSGLLHVPSMRRNTQSRWGGASSSRTSNSSISGERDPMLYEESMSRNIPRSISEHPMFVPDSEIGSSSQQPTNWNLAGNNIAGNLASTSRAGSGSGIINSSGPSWSNRARPQYSRRLLEIVRRSLLSSTGIESSGVQSSGQAVRSSSSQGMTISSGSGNHGRHLSSSRPALSERQHVDGAFGLPYSVRSLAGGGEGRTSIMSEHIRHVLDLMRRGEGLRFEDMMILDHSVFFGMTDIHDRHRDMRLDVDNMSYEELLALEERIGNVCTGLNEETIMSRLKQQRYINRGAQNQAETEPCSICREEYNDGEDLGRLECGHDFHRDCIKQWLMHKNLCPICKTTGMTT